MRLLYWMDVAVFLGFGVWALAHMQWNARYLVGTGLAAAGFALWIVARVQLGTSFGVRARAKRLVTTGLYSKFRHPIYLFGGIAYLGLFIAWGKLIPALCFLLIYSTQIVRIKKEEAVLEQAFGEAYRQYKMRSWF